VALREGRLEEGMVRAEDLPHVTELAYLNSLRRWIAAEKA